MVLQRLEKQEALLMMVHLCRYIMFHQATIYLNSATYLKEKAKESKLRVVV